MPTQPDTWYKKLAGQPWVPVHFLAGEELLVIEAADALRRRAREWGYAEREVIEVKPRFNWNELARAGSGMSLFARKRVIDLRLINRKVGRDGSAAISEWCKHPPADTLLLMTCSPWSKKQEGAWTRAIDRVGERVVFWPPYANQWVPWIQSRLASRGVNATRDAAQLLAERVEGNLLAAAQEVDKLAAMGHSGRLDAAAMQQLIADSTRFDVFKLMDAAMSGQAARTVRIVRGLQAEGNEVLPLMGWVVNQLQLLIRMAQASNFAAQAKTERLWAARQRLVQAALRRGDARHWQRCLGMAARIDRMAKGREQGDVWLEVERLMLTIAQPALAKVSA